MLQVGRPGFKTIQKSKQPVGSLIIGLGFPSNIVLWGGGVLEVKFRYRWVSPGSDPEISSKVNPPEHIYQLCRSTTTISVFLSSLLKRTPCSY